MPGRLRRGFPCIVVLLFRSPGFFRRKPLGRPTPASTPCRRAAGRFESRSHACPYTSAPMNLLDLKGKTAVVTGAAKGIGKTTAALLEKAGAKGARVDIEEAPGCIRADVSDEAAVEKAFARIGAQFGGTDILVNNAGIAVRKTAFDITADEWDRVIGVNVRGSFLCARAAARSMKERGGGAIVNLASIMGFSGGIFPNPAYQTSKGEVVNMTRALALEFAEHRIR